ncbi:MFS transporter [Streptomyces lomondensis]|uniref:MFS transporter n=1 Tax=Streptomyces lomondensis TaxID=68229 RepID=A0ABQ2XF34_9ACTN|nr:MFS transporter [Streptomyces lomondensis]MCF0077617.1 MFS transporter [Streptomyces lomondensis]GGX13874.1 MFS transporter [Streptomyces lomondensis]
MRETVTQSGDHHVALPEENPALPEDAGPGDRMARRAVIASTIGSAIEWYDFYLYSTASAVLLGPLFFPQHSSATATLAAFATYAAGFVARPVGGAIIGHFGDRIGRKAMLVLTLVTMGAATFLVGLLPTYEQAGLWAPVLLVTLRVVQGIGIGGEWGGGVLITTEHAPSHRRGLFSSFPAAGFPIGLAASTGMISLITLMPEDALLSWGWRLPFLASAILVLVGVVVRLGVAESPEFVREHARGTLAKAPIADVLRERPGQAIRGALAALGLAMIVSTYSVYLLAYGSTRPEARTELLNGLMIGAVLEALLLPVFGMLSDRFGRRRIILFGYTVCALVVLPAPHWMTSGNSVLSGLTFALALGVGHAAVYGGFAAFLVELFPTRQRYSALALTYQLGATIASFGPLVAGALADGERTATPGIYLLLGTLLVSGMAVATTRPAPRPLRRQKT